MRQSSKGKQWPFGMKLPVGVDDESGLVQSMATPAANVHELRDLRASGDLLDGEEERVRADGGYQSIEKREEHKDRQVAWPIALRSSRRRALPKGEPEDLMERRKASVQAQVEQVFFSVKRMFGYGKVRYRGLANKRLGREFPGLSASVLTSQRK